MERPALASPLQYAVVGVGTTRSGIGATLALSKLPTAIVLVSNAFLLQKDHALEGQSVCVVVVETQPGKVVCRVRQGTGQGQ